MSSSSDPSHPSPQGPRIRSPSLASPILSPLWYSPLVLRPPPACPIGPLQASIYCYPPTINAGESYTCALDVDTTVVAATLLTASAGPGFPSPTYYMPGPSLPKQSVRIPSRRTGLVHPPTRYPHSDPRSTRLLGLEQWLAAFDHPNPRVGQPLCPHQHGLLRRPRHSHGHVR